MNIDKQDDSEILSKQREILIRQQLATPRLHLMAPGSAGLRPNSDKKGSLLESGLLEEQNTRGLSFWNDESLDLMGGKLQQDTSYAINQSIVDQYGSA